MLKKYPSFLKTHPSVFGVSVVDLIVLSSMMSFTAILGIGDFFPLIVTAILFMALRIYRGFFERSHIELFLKKKSVLHWAHIRRNINGLPN